MPIVPGTQGIKSWSYELVIPADTGTILCEDCAREVGIDPESEDVSPIFADQEWDYAPSCDRCGYVSDIVTVLNPDKE